VLGLSGFVLGCKKRTAPTDSGDSKDKGGSGASGPTRGTTGTFTIGKSTTLVTGPVEADGHIDYAAALNERLSKGVKPEDNAAVAIWKVLGPNPAGSGKVPPGFFEKLGMPAPPASGEYFVGLRQGSDAVSKLAARPWTSNENAAVSTWLQSNEKPLAALREAVKKPQFYSPIIPEKGEKGSKGIISALLPGAQTCREVAAAFACRAMLYLGHGNSAEAWQDLLACHRLGRLVGRGGPLIEGLVGMAIELIACRGDVAFLDRAKPDAKLIERCLRDLLALPPLPPVVDKVDLSERYQLLDTIMLLDRNGLAHLTGVAEGQPAVPAGFGDALAGIDWNPALETANKWFDRMAAAMRETDRTKRNQQLGQIEAEMRNLKSNIEGGAALKNAGTPTARGQAVGDILVTLLMPAVGKVQDAADRARQTFDTVIVAYALTWYQRFNGQYPDSLAKLAPTYLSAVPLDFFSGRDLIYKPGPNGFLLYSVGVNGRDDGGRGYDGQPAGDDIVVQIPQPAKP
jgi:hypothetical protein